MTTSTTSKSNLRQAWGRLIRARPRLRAALTGEQISKRSWAKKVYTFEALPEAFQPIASDLLLDKQAFPYVVLTPTFEGFLKRENEKLVFCLDHRLYILENDQQKVTTTSYELENIYRIEFGEILLKAWIHICGMDDQGHFSTTQLRFNSVTDFLFNPFIEALRHAEQPAVPGDMQQEREKFSPLKWKHFKFMNYARNSLLPGERVEHYILQPEMEIDRTKLFGMTVLKRTICLTHILIQTDRELILIRDGESSQRSNDGGRYGGIWNYIPLKQLQDLIIEDVSDGLVNLTIKLPAEDNLSMPFTSERRPELEQFIQKVNETIKHPVL
jgi:hypothetical protein